MPIINRPTEDSRVQISDSDQSIFWTQNKTRKTDQTELFGDLTQDPAEAPPLHETPYGTTYNTQSEEKHLFEYSQTDGQVRNPERATEQYLGQPSKIIEGEEHAETPNKKLDFNS